VEKLERYRQQVLGAIGPVGAEGLAFAAAAGRYLAEPAAARCSAPPCRCSAMDGFAVRSAEVPGAVALPTSQVIYAGDVPAPLRPGEAARIFTGAPLPDGADAVIREEEVRLEEGRARFRRAAVAGENVRQAGEDVVAGAEALPAGTRLGARQMGLLAAVGVGEVVVRRRVRVALLSTGDELVRKRTPDSNGVALEGLLREIGADVARLVVGDDLPAIQAAVAGALAGADALVTIGGVSVGERDHVPAALERAGASVRFHGVPMKPGKPFLFAEAGGRPVLGLPGSPSACLVAFEVFARPALLRLAGAARVFRPVLRLPLAGRAEGRPGRDRFLWAALDGGRTRPLGRDAAQVRGPALAEALVRIPADRGDVTEGEAAETWLLGDGG
jgi:molybdopterin molybdotransferase